MKKTLLSIVALLTLTLFVRSGYAHAYSGNADVTWVFPNCHLAVSISTDENKWTFIFSGPWGIVLPTPAVFFLGSWSIWDDLGYHHANPCHNSGTVVFTDYVNRGTWTHTKVIWRFVFPEPLIGWWEATAQVDLYIPLTDDSPEPDYGGGGGGFGKAFYR